MWKNAKVDGLDAKHAEEAYNKQLGALSQLQEATSRQVRRAGDAMKAVGAKSLMAMRSLAGGGGAKGLNLGLAAAAARAAGGGGGAGGDGEGAAAAAAAGDALDSLDLGLFGAQAAPAKRLAPLGPGSSK